MRPSASFLRCRKKPKTQKISEREEVLELTRAVDPHSPTLFLYRGCSSPSSSSPFIHSLCSLPRSVLLLLSIPLSLEYWLRCEFLHKSATQLDPLIKQSPREATVTLYTFHLRVRVRPCARATVNVSLGAHLSRWAINLSANRNPSDLRCLCLLMFCPSVTLWCLCVHASCMCASVRLMNQSLCELLHFATHWSS